MTGSRVSAQHLIDLVLDTGSVQSWDEPPQRGPVSLEYGEALARAAERSGVDEAVLTGRGQVEGADVAFVVGEFRFLAGSIGVATADRIVRAVERATELGLPLLASTSSGGTRMQEGTVAFVQMLRIAGAIAAHKAAGLPYLVYLRHPTTGGVTATWGSLGHITVAEPGALVGFLGPRVYEAMHGEPFPEGVQVAENLRDKGVIDTVLPAEELRAVLPTVLGLLSGEGGTQADGEVAHAQRDGGSTPTPERTSPSTGTATAPRHTSNRHAWEAVLESRDPRRPGVREVLVEGADEFVRLSGSGEGERHDALLMGLARFGGRPCVLVGQDRHHQHRGALLGPGALREARRGFRLADELGLPLLTVIDTPGAELSAHAEEGALAGEIARCIAQLMALRTSHVSVLLGEGGGGGALALLPADLTIATPGSWLAPLPPEGASAIVHRTPDRADEMAESQQIDAGSMRDNGIVDVLLPNARPASVAAALSAALAEVAGRKRTGADLARERRQRYSRVGHGAGYSS